MSARVADEVAEDPEVLSVEPDQVMIPAGKTSYVPSGPQMVGNSLRRTYAADPGEVACEHKGTPNPKVNARIDIDCVDDYRVDVDVAVLDGGIDNSADLNVVNRVDCVHPAFQYREPNAPYVSPPGPEAPEYSL